MITSAGIRALANRVRTEKNPAALAGILNEKRIAKVVVHPFFDYFQGNGEKGKYAAYLDNLVRLFPEKESYKNTFFILEYCYEANDVARVIFESQGGEFALKNPPIYSTKGWILEESRENRPTVLDDVLLYMNNKSMAVEKLAASLAVSDGVVVFGMYLEYCIKRAVSDIWKIAARAGRAVNGADRDFFISVNRNFTLAAKDFQKK